MTQPELKRVLSLRDVVLFYVVAIVGPRWIASAAAAGPSSLVIWALACLGMFIPSAFCVLELSNRYPEEGGIYLWTKEAFGEFPSFITGWLYWASNLVYLPGLLYFAAGNILYMGGERWLAHSADPVYFIVFSLVGLAVAAWVNIVGLDIGKHLNNIGAWATWVPVGLLVVMGGVAWWQFGTATTFEPRSMMPSWHLKDIAFWSTLAFAFGGLETASLMGGEIKDPRSTIPKAILISGIIVAAIYMLGTFATLLALPAEDATGLQGIMQAIDRTALRIGLGGVTPAAAFMISLGSLGGVGAWLAACGRIPFVAGIDKALPAAFGRLHSKYNTPAFALVFQTIICALFVFMGQAGTTVRSAYGILVNMAIIAFFIPYAMMYLAYIRVQWIPAGPEVRRTPGGRPMAVLLGVMGFTTVVVSIILACLPPADDPAPIFAVVKVVGLSLVLVALGVILFFVGRRRTAMPS
ncbi:MAG TPA: APC family permease [Gemmatimonadales bacterium]|nr:APC family permease [Gemmatimonadales bacterium]